MSTLISKKYILFAIACSFFIGCVLGSSEIFNLIVIIPILILGLLLLYLNRKNKHIVVVAILFITMSFAAMYYNAAASRQSSLHQYEGRRLSIIGIVEDDPIATEYGSKVLLKNVYYTNNGKLFKCNEKLQVYVSKKDKPEFGDKINMSVSLESISKLRNFGDFNFEKYYQSKNLFMKAYTEQIIILGSNKAGFISTILYNSKQKVRKTIFAALPKQEAALLYGILTGSKAEIDEDVIQVFTKTGLAHILSVSGLHIGFLVLLLTYLLKPFKLRELVNSSIIMCVVIFYILLIGAPVPAVRALLMFAVMLAGKATGQKYDLNTSASFAALALLLYNPFLIHDPGFIISISCIFSIAFFHQPVSKLLNFLPSILRSSLALSIAVWIGITPVLIYYFNYVSIINIFLNVLAVPIAFVITLAGFVAVVIGLVIPSAAIFVFSIAYFMIKLLYLLSEKALLLPFTGFVIPSLTWATYLVYYSVVIILIEDFWKYKTHRFKSRYTAAITAAIILLLCINFIPLGELRIYFVDVGQGDCSVIRTPSNKTIVIDGGGQAQGESSFDVGEKITVPALLHLGVGKVDTVIVSHIHDDHLGGILSILESLKVGRVLLPASDSYGVGEFSSENYDKLLRICKERDIPIIYMKDKSSISLDPDIILKALGPDEPFLEQTSSDPNNNSLVLELEYRSFQALFTGDIQQEAEQRLQDKDIKCDVLKVAHHGSPYSTTQEFLDSAAPKMSIISVGRNNYGHPSKEIIDRLIDSGARVYRTDMSGAVLISTNGKQLKINTVR